jgi:hypothetical protein
VKGSVFTEFLNMVEARFTPEVADRTITAAALPSDDAYTTVGTYGDASHTLVRPFSCTETTSRTVMGHMYVLSFGGAELIAEIVTTIGASGYLAQPLDPERLIMMLQPYVCTVLPAPIAVDAADRLSAGQGQPSHARGSV